MHFERNIEEQIATLLNPNLNLCFAPCQVAEIAGRELPDVINIPVEGSVAMPEKIGTEGIEATAERSSEFVRALKYDFSYRRDPASSRCGTFI
jgi:hypothetical protein